VLAVDPSAASLANLREALVRFGMKPALHEDGSTALVAFEAANRRGTPFPFVLLDREQLCPSKFELLEQIRQRNQISRIVVLATHRQTCQATECGCSGVDAFIHKPLDQSDLEQVLRSLVNGAAAKRAKAALNGEPAREESGAPLRVLLVEDNPVNQKVALSMLRKRGHQVTTASNGQEGLNAASRASFDVVLMDVQMPVMDGWETSLAIRALERESGTHLPIIAMTAHALKEDIERCRAAGMDGYISKPFQIETLFEELNRVLKLTATHTPVESS
jgi:two-component system, sensor histidine kinase and response regulator